MSSQLAIRELREVGASAGRRQNGKLTHGKTWILGAVDLVSLTLAYVMTYALAAKVGTLPPVSAPAWFLGLVAALGVPAWLSIFAGYGLYENDNQKISVASFDEVRDVFHAMLVGSLLLLIVSQGVRWAFGLVGLLRRRGRVLRRRSARPRAGRARRHPQLGLPARDAAAAHADRRQRTGGAARLPQDPVAP